MAVNFLINLKNRDFTEGEKGLIKGNVEVRQYIDDMDTCMSACDLVIGRAGASSLLKSRLWVRLQS